MIFNGIPIKFGVDVIYKLKISQMNEINLHELLTILNSEEIYDQTSDLKFPENNPFRDILKDILGEKSIQGEKLKDTLIKLLEELNRSAGGHGWPSFNLYPSEDRSECHRVCIGIATRDFGHNCSSNNQCGFSGLMLNLIGHWFTCYNNNKFTLIITPDWNTSQFEKDWKSIINSHCSTGKRVLIVEFIASNRFLVRHSN